MGAYRCPVGACSRRDGLQLNSGAGLSLGLFSMHARTLSSTVGLVAACVLPGCSASEVARDPATESATAVARLAPPPWHRSARSLDLTGDGRPDSVHLEAVGTRLDSLRITLTLLVGGEAKLQETWGSSYELALADSAVRVGPRADAFMRARLDTILASVVVQPFTARGVRLMAEDSAVLAGLDPRPSQRISFAYGYETTVRLVWDAARERFVRLWSCC